MLMTLSPPVPPPLPSSHLPVRAEHDAPMMSPDDEALAAALRLRALNRRLKEQFNQGHYRAVPAGLAAPVR